MASDKRGSNIHRQKMEHRDHTVVIVFNMNGDGDIQIKVPPPPLSPLHVQPYIFSANPRNRYFALSLLN